MSEDMRYVATMRDEVNSVVERSQGILVAPAPCVPGAAQHEALRRRRGAVPRRGAPSELAFPAARYTLDVSSQTKHSIRINDQWRICFTWTTEGPANVEIVDYH